MKPIRTCIILFILLLTFTSGCTPISSTDVIETKIAAKEEQAEPFAKQSNIPIDIPSYNGEPYTAINDNIPYFLYEETTTQSFEKYSSLDSLGRCGITYACIGIDLMPTEERGNIGQVKPSGWHTVKYDNVDGKYLYNRCHLIGYQLTAENANEKNLITGTRYMNVDGMLPFENMVADYVKETENHVLYRVTPIYEGSNLVANGVQMEAKSVEDDGAGILYNVFVYNVQPGISINYATGDSSLNSSGVAAIETDSDTELIQKQEADYILNTNSKKIHYITCSSVSNIKNENKEEYTEKRDDLISQGYAPCGICKP